MELKNLKLELKGCVDFFLDNYSKEEKTFGLILDTVPTKNHNYSIAGSGYLYPALVLKAIEEPENCLKYSGIAAKSIKTLFNLESSHGWFYHFYNLDGSKNEWSELSNIDSAILFEGVLFAGSYFKGEVLELALNLFNRVDFNYFLKEYKTMLSMAVDRDGKFIGHWDVYAEQLMLYVLGAASENEEFRLDKEIYYNFKRPLAKYKDIEFIESWYGSLFTFQYSHAYIDFRNKVDRVGTNWFKNSINASKAAYQYALDEEGKFKSFHRLSWGLTACANIDGYSGLYGSPPCGYKETYNDGTVAPCAAIGSIIFTPKESIDALNYYYSIPKLIGKYGLYDSYNEDKNYYSNKYISIDKGIEMCMIANYLDNTIYKYFNELTIIKNAFKRLEIKEE